MTGEKPDRQDMADRLKERIYVTFTALAVLLLLRSHGETGAVEALVTLVVAVLATLLAVFIADILAHTTVHERLPSTTEVRHVLSVTGARLGRSSFPSSGSHSAPSGSSRRTPP
jgi:hypothetical protein